MSNDPRTRAKIPDDPNYKARTFSMPLDIYFHILDNQWVREHMTDTLRRLLGLPPTK